MIVYVEGNLFESPAQVLVNTVNTVGVMGKGLAYEFKRIYPEMFQHYQALCEGGQLDIGKLWLYKTPHKWILNFPTKRHWRQPSQPSYIEAGLRKFVATFAEKGITAISFPMLGCGNGELDWETQVRPMMEHYLGPLSINTYIHVHRQDDLIPEHHDKKTIMQWLRSEPQTLSFFELWEDLAKLIQPHATFQTLDDQTSFVVHLQDDGLLFHVGNQTTPLFFSKDGDSGLLSIWQDIRNSGYVFPDSFPQEVAPVLLKLLSQLDYIQLVSLARASNAPRQMGLQLRPIAPVSHPKTMTQHERF